MTSLFFHFAQCRALKLALFLIVGAVSSLLVLPVYTFKKIDKFPYEHVVHMYKPPTGLKGDQRQQSIHKDGQVSDMWLHHILYGIWSLVIQWHWVLCI